MDKTYALKLLRVDLIIKIPLMIYLVIGISTVPTIQALQHNTILGAHRGNSLDHTENTLGAFESALEQEKYQFIEFDIQYTKDKKIVVIHQNNMFRIPKNLAIVEDLTYEELQEEFEFKIPQYLEVMDLINNKKPVNIEIKSGGDFEADKELVEFIIQDCKERKICERVLISSPSEDIISYIEENHPEIKSGRVYWITFLSILPFESATKEFYENSKADYLLLHGYNLKNSELLLKYKPENKKLIFWYFTDEVYIIDYPEECDEFWE